MSWTVTEAVILTTPDSALRVAGLSVLQRMVFALERAGVRAIALVADDGAEPSAMPATRRPETRLRRCAPDDLAPATGGDILVFRRAVVLDVAAAEALVGLGSAAHPVQAIDAVDRTGVPVATGALLVAAEAAADLPRLIIDGAGAAPRRALAAGVCHPLAPGAGAREGRAAETALLASLRRKSDGFFAYWFDRRISTALSRHLVRTGVTPNQITVATLVPALLGAVLLALPGTVSSGIGALLYWLSTVLDGCDGEVARLKYRESPSGARLDLLCDNVGLVALFLGIVVHVYREVPGLALVYAGAAIVGGMLAAMILEYRLITRPRIRQSLAERALTPAERRRRQIYERLASRDFAYLLPILAFTGTLSWFVWATALGVNLFWLALLVLVVRKPARAALPDVSPDRP
ncbi:MAG: CDP-alcohol phosphatidyltransferase family protein [Candidatus Eiseniibacteriota bacterium]